jgi:hypothetical protein
MTHYESEKLVIRLREWRLMWYFYCKYLAHPCRNIELDISQQQRFETMHINNAISVYRLIVK